MNKVMRIGTIETHGGGHVSIYVKSKIDNGRLSISGVIGPSSAGNAYGGCGQIDMEFSHRQPADNDNRHSNPTTPKEINFAPGWNAELWLDLLDVWKRWHLNDMRAGCEHQRSLGWKYADHHNPKTYQGEACPTCGYEIGSSWLTEELPQSVIDFINSLPDTDRQPAWV